MRSVVDDPFESQRVQGKALERFAQMTNWNYYEAARRFQKV